MTREEAIWRLENCLECTDCFTCGSHDTALVMAIAALREQEERSKGCDYCDIAKANEGVVCTKLWVKETETNKWTMMGKKLIYCPMCGRKLDKEDA